MSPSVTTWSRRPKAGAVVGGAEYPQHQRRSALGVVSAITLRSTSLRRGDVRVKDWASLNANAKYFTEARVGGDEELGEQGRTSRRTGSPRTSRCARSCGSWFSKSCSRTTSTCWSIRRSRSRRRGLAMPASRSVNGRPARPIPDQRQPRHSGDHGARRFQPVVYEPQYVLNAAKDNYVGRPTTTANPRSSPRCRSASRSGPGPAMRRSSSRCRGLRGRHETSQGASRVRARRRPGPRHPRGLRRSPAVPHPAAGTRPPDSGR